MLKVCQKCDCGIDGADQYAVMMCCINIYAQRCAHDQMESLNP